MNALDFIDNHKKANLAPMLLRGMKTGITGAGGTSGPRNQVPEDCFVDFDFRLVDLFEKMERSAIKLADLAKEEYLRIKSDLGHVPNRVDYYG